MSEPAFVARLPAPPLRPWIDRYLGYRAPASPGGVHRGLPQRHLTMIVAIGEPIEVLAHTDPTQEPGTYGFVLSGLQVRPALIAAGRPEEGVAVELTPLGARAVLGLPAAALWDTTVEASTVIGGAAGELRERLHESPRWTERFDRCDDVLGRLVARSPAGIAPQLAAGWRRLVASGGTLPAGRLAADLGWSRRHLAQRFKAEFGLPPKAAARLVRFHRACGLLRGVARPPLAEVAVVCGYYDQPHLTRDFVGLAGVPPGEWLASEAPPPFPSVQDRDPGARAGSGT